MVEKGVIACRKTSYRMYHGIAQPATGVWHDCINQLRMIRETTKLKDFHDKAIDAWQSFGEAIGAREGVNVVTLSKPSTPSDKNRYWDIPKQCFYGPCICSMPLVDERPRHRFRTCKGCYRVLYCNKKCQSL